LKGAAHLTAAIPPLLTPDALLAGKVALADGQAEQSLLPISGIT
jgi:hypothetical protein